MLPYYEWWNDRIDRALSASTPLAIEQDLHWYTDPKTGKFVSLVAHGAPMSGHEPTMEHYFFDRVKPQHAHDHGLWIRFYTLDGATEKEESCNGWFKSYNFGSLAAAELRWHAAQRAGVDYIASDQYEQLGSYLRGPK